MSSAPLLTRQEISSALQVLAARGKEKRRVCWRNNLAIFALVTCAGMTAREISALDIRDFRDREKTRGSTGEVEIKVDPHFRLGADPCIPNDPRPLRIIPLNWHEEVAKILVAHFHYRHETEVRFGDPFIAGAYRGRGRLSPGNVTNTYAHACKLAGFAADRRLVSLGIKSFTVNALGAGIDSDAVRQVRGLLLPGEQLRISAVTCLYTGMLGR